jgi:P-type Cu+ transporter
MHCGSCVALVEESLIATPGVRHASVDLDAGSARVEFDPGATTVADLCAVVAGAGYEATVRKAADSES